MKNYYLILGVEPNATKKQIENAYRTKLQFLHPDKWQSNPEMLSKAVELSRELNEAYKVLSDEIKRREYDEILNRSTNRIYEEKKQPRKAGKSNQKKKDYNPRSHSNAPKTTFQYQEVEEYGEKSSFKDNAEKVLALIGSIIIGGLCAYVFTMPELVAGVVIIGIFLFIVYLIRGKIF